MVIWFNNEKARKHLLQHGFVYTLRPKKRREGTEPIFWNTFKKRGTVNVVFKFEVTDPTQLIQFVQHSGFDSVKEWLEEAKNSRLLYWVHLLKLEDEA